VGDFLTEGTVVAELGGSSRSVVRRVRAGDRTVIVKRFTGDTGGFAREAAALGVLPPSAPVPRLLEVIESPPTVVMSDEGGGSSVADLLLGSSSPAAVEGLMSWAAAVARLHDVSVDLGDAFRAALFGRPASTVADDLTETVAALTVYAAGLQVPVPDGTWDGLRGLGDRLEGGPAVLSPGDTCPDNNVDTPRGRVLLDFESAQWRHPAWDVAYLVVPWPTCWCSWRLPDEVAEQAIHRYQEASALPWARSAGFRSDIEVAAVVWAFMTSAMFLERALGDDPPPADPAKVMPPRRALILDRLATAALYRPPRAPRELDALSGFAIGLRAALVDRWGEVALPCAPAF
jgi:aminoglycoside phosphotransferase (APT) family kinase protein